MVAALMTLLIAGIVWLIHDWKKGHRKRVAVIGAIIAVWFILSLSMDYWRYETAEVGMYDIRRDRLTDVIYVKGAHSLQWNRTGARSIREIQSRLIQKQIQDTLDH